MKFSKFSSIHFLTAVIFCCCSSICSFTNGSSLSNVPDTVNIKKLSSDEKKIFQLEKAFRMNLKILETRELELLIVKDIVDSWTFIEEFMGVKDEVNRIARSISEQVEPAKTVLNDICTFLTNKEHKNQVFYSLLHPCPNHDNIEVKIKHFYNEIYQNLTSEMNFEHLLSDRNLIFSNYLKEIIRKTHNLHSSRQYFLSTSDHGKIENCNNVPDIPQFMRIYYSSIVNKTMILLIDQTSEQMDVSKIVAKKLISTLNENDKITLILISDKVSFFTSSKSCQNDSEYSFNTSPEVKTKVYDFIDSINRTNEIANHSLIFETAFDVISRIYGSSNERLPISLLYISEGVTNTPADTKNVLKVINDAQSRLPHPVIINSAITANRPFPTQTQFLIDISSQNYEKFGINSTSWNHRRKYITLGGQMFHTNKDFDDLSRNLMLCLADLYNYKSFIEHKVMIHEPYHDHFINDNVMSFSKTCEQKGIFSLDLYLSNIIKEIYSNDITNTYKFLVMKNGRTIAHSKRYPAPMKSKNLKLVDITLLENSENFTAAWHDKIKLESEGNITIGNQTYTWKHITNLMIICIVSEDIGRISYKSLVRVKKPNLQVNDLIYHRLDLIKPISLNYCQYYKQIVTFDAISLHLSSKSFLSPFEHVSMKHDKNYNSQIVQNFIAYLRDTKNLFANPGLQKNVKNEVLGIFQIMDLFKKKHLDSEFKKYVIRRYVASPNGILEIFPGCQLNSDFEVTNRPWFVKAMEQPHKMVITEPYLDSAGADYIVSVAYAFQDQKSRNSNNKQSVIIVSMDFTRGFFYKLLLDSLPDCNDESIKCFLMSDNGFLIAHPTTVEFPESMMKRRHPEHLTHLESFVANDILMQKKFVEKISCNNYFNGTSQRFYKFNTSINEIITNIPNFANIEKTKYQIINVRDTNLFVGIINSTSEASGAFCPCSTIDFRCLNCLRMEQIECECPCECRIHSDNTCTTNNETMAPVIETLICPKPIENIHATAIDPISKDSVEACTLFHCDMFLEKEDCLGVIGCTW